MMTGKANNMAMKLREQVAAICKRSNSGSFSTRARYKAAALRACDFLAERFGLQKFPNLKEKHVAAYAAYLLEDKESCASYVKTELAALRSVFFKATGNELESDNRKLGIPDRKHLCQMPALPMEIDAAMELCEKCGDYKTKELIRAMHTFGVRLNECVCLRYEDVLNARNTGKLHISHGTKGGRARDVTIETEFQQVYLNALANYAATHKKRRTDAIFSDRYTKGDALAVKRRVENFFQKNQQQIRHPDRSEDENVSPHSLRRTFAQETYNRARESGMDSKRALEKVNAVLGHGKGRLDTTRVYVWDKY